MYAMNYLLDKLDPIAKGLPSPALKADGEGLWSFAFLPS